MPRINTKIRNGDLLPASQEMIQQCLEAIVESHPRLRKIDVSVDVGNLDEAKVEITAPLGNHEFISKASAKSAVEAVDEAVKNLHQQLTQHLQERKSLAEQEESENSDASFKQIGGTLAAVLLAILVGFIILRIDGCGSGERKLYHVSGTMTFDAQPVPAGFVLFDPDISAGNDGTQGYAEIKDGSFDTANTGKGITGGAYVMRVRGFVPPQGDVPGKMLFQEYKQTIQLENDDSQHDIIVPASARAKSELLPDPT